MQKDLRTCLLLSLIILFSLFLTEVDVTPHKTFKVVKAEVAYGYWSFTDERVKYLAENFGMIDTGYHPNKAEDIKQLKQLNPDIKVILYNDILGTSETHLFKDWSEIDPHEDWFIHDLDGNRMLKMPWKWYFLDPASEGWRKYYADLCVEMLEVIPDADGIMVDDCWAKMNTWNWVTPYGTAIPPDKCPTLPNFNSDMHEFLAYVKKRIGNKLLIPNTNTYNGYMDVCDGKLSEGFVHPGWWTSTYFSNSFDYMNQMREYQALVKDGEYFFVCDGIDDLETATQQNTERVFYFCLASYMLIVEGDRVSFYFGTWKNFNDKYSLLAKFDRVEELGLPKTDMYEWQYGLERDFEHGKVIVNFSPYSSVVSLEKTFRTLDGDLVTSVTVPQYTGVILFEGAS